MVGGTNPVNRLTVSPNIGVREHQIKLSDVRFQTGKRRNSLKLPMFSEGKWICSWNKNASRAVKN